jgi:hypothetical protein
MWDGLQTWYRTEQRLSIFRMIQELIEKGVILWTVKCHGETIVLPKHIKLVGKLFSLTYYTFPHQMSVDAGCKIVVVRGDPASSISNVSVNTVLLQSRHGQWMSMRINNVSTLAVHAGVITVLTRLIHGRTRMSTDEQDLSSFRWYLCSYCDLPCSVRD